MQINRFHRRGTAFILKSAKRSIASGKGAKKCRTNLVFRWSDRWMKSRGNVVYDMISLDNKKIYNEAGIRFLWGTIFL